MGANLRMPGNLYKAQRVSRVLEGGQPVGLMSARQFCECGDQWKVHSTCMEGQQEA